MPYLLFLFTLARRLAVHTCLVCIPCRPFLSMASIQWHCKWISSFSSACNENGFIAWRWMSCIRLWSPGEECLEWFFIFPDEVLWTKLPANCLQRLSSVSTTENADTENQALFVWGALNLLQSYKKLVIHGIPPPPPPLPLNIQASLAHAQTPSLTILSLLLA